MQRSNAAKKIYNTQRTVNGKNPVNVIKNKIYNYNDNATKRSAEHNEFSATFRVNCCGLAVERSLYVWRVLGAIRAFSRLMLLLLFYQLLLFYLVEYSLYLLLSDLTMKITT